MMNVFFLKVKNVEEDIQIYQKSQLAQNVAKVQTIHLYLPLKKKTFQKKMKNLKKMMKKIKKKIKLKNIKEILILKILKF